MDDKTKIRKKFLKIRMQIPEPERARKSRQILKNLESLSFFSEANHILLYYTHKEEVDTLPLTQRYIEKKQLYLPVIRGKSHFQAVPIKNPLTLRQGYEGVPEPYDPEPNRMFDDRIELILIPGVAFDKKGMRLGMGKGYYDRYLQKQQKALKIGLAFEEQVLDHVPKEAYDVAVDLIVTDRQIYRCRENLNS